MGRHGWCDDAGFRTMSDLAPLMLSHAASDPPMTPVQAGVDGSDQPAESWRYSAGSTDGRRLGSDTIA
jgi:hypothetical protein